MHELRSRYVRAQHRLLELPRLRYRHILVNDWRRRIFKLLLLRSRDVCFSFRLIGMFKLPQRHVSAQHGIVELCRLLERLVFIGASEFML